MAQVAPAKYTLPTGAELMSRPMTDPGESKVDTKNRELLKEINEEIDDMEVHIRKDTMGFTWWVAASCSTIWATFLFAYSFFLAEAVQIALGILALVLYIPCIFVFARMLCCRHEASQHNNDRLKTKYKRRQTSRVMNMLEQSKQADLKKQEFHVAVRVYAFIKGSHGRNSVNMKVEVNTLYDLALEVERKTGLTIDRQIHKFNGVELKDLTQHFELYKVKDNDTITVYNKGWHLAYLTAHPPTIILPSNRQAQYLEDKYLVESWDEVTLNLRNFNRRSSESKLSFAEQV
jgi:hypothetical protein